MLYAKRNHSFYPPLFFNRATPSFLTSVGGLTHKEWVISEGGAGIFHEFSHNVFRQGNAMCSTLVCVTSDWG